MGYYAAVKIIRGSNPLFRIHPKIAENQVYNCLVAKPLLCNIPTYINNCTLFNQLDVLLTYFDLLLVKSMLVNPFVTQKSNINFQIYSKLLSSNAAHLHCKKAEILIEIN